MNTVESQQPVLLCNVWDVQSAQIAEELGFQMVGTSSGAIASKFGYEDGEEISFEELLYVVKRIKASTSLPLSVDLEAGYGKTATVVVKNIEELIKIGVVAINIEDSVVNDKRELLQTEQFASFLQEITEEIGLAVHVNVRTDAYLLNHPNKFTETLHRIDAYQAAGADGIFIPCITNNEEIEKLCAHTSLPVNVMCMPELDNFETLYQLGVKRISMGNFVYNRAQDFIKQALATIQKEQGFQSLFQ